MKHMSPFYMGVYSLKICHEFYIENNLNLTELYSECNFDLSDFKNPNATIHIDTFIRSLDLMKKNIPIGVTLEEAIFRHLKISDLGNFGFILMSSPTLEDCLDLIVRGFQSVNPSFVFKMMHVNDREFDFIVKNDFYYKHHHESIMNLFVLVFFDLLSFFVDDISCLKRKGEGYKKRQGEKGSR